MCPSTRSFYSLNGSSANDQIGDDDASHDSPSTDPSIPSSAKHFKCRNQVREIQLHKRNSRDLALKLATRIEGRFGCLWKPVDGPVINWRPEEGE